MNRIERTGLIRVVELLGADITLSMPPYAPTTRAIRARLRAAIDPSYASWPGDSLARTAELCVVIDAETPRQQQVMLRSALQQGGVLADEIAWVWYAQHRDTGWMEDAIEAADARVMLLVGSGPVAWWRGDVQLRQVAGGLYPASLGGSTRRRLTGIIESPGAVLRGLVDARGWRVEVARVCQAVLDRDTEDVDKLTWGCAKWHREKEVRCGQHAAVWDELGLPWCGEHADKGWTAGVKKAAAVRKQKNLARQEGML